MISLIVTLATVFALAGGAQPPDSTSSVATPRAASAPLSQGLLLSNYLSRHRADVPSPAYLTFTISPFTTTAYVPETRFDAMLFGAGAAGTLAMFIGAIGNTIGAFDEDTTWIMTGAAAAAGAIYSGSRFKINATLRPEPWSIPTGPPPSP
ncbi:MAG TPA: hypothetical protein VFU38_08510 [Candidatus Krumholzibacteria bacterium]|nr:hypothetical protein [Candidatus Krumholzibacteria bacterium]